jgi:hypothetical protein
LGGGGAAAAASAGTLGGVAVRAKLLRLPYHSGILPQFDVPVVQPSVAVADSKSSTFGPSSNSWHYDRRPTQHRPRMRWPQRPRHLVVKIKWRLVRPRRCVERQEYDQGCQQERRYVPDECSSTRDAVRYNHNHTRHNSPQLTWLLP